MLLPWERENSMHLGWWIAFPIALPLPLLLILQLETENSKLKYQCAHLKKAVVEGDEKLAAALHGKQ